MLARTASVVILKVHPHGCAFAKAGLFSQHAMTNPPTVEILTGTLHLGKASCTFRIDRHPGNKAYAVVQTPGTRARIDTTHDEVDALVRTTFLEMIKRDAAR